MKYVISDCNVVDVENDGRILPHKDILVDGSVIAKISEHGKEIFEGARRIDATGCYAVPGLIDLHVHLFGTGMPSKVLGAGKSQQRLIRFIHTGLGKKILGALVSSAAKNQLYSGVTTLRAVGDFCGSDIELKRRTDAGKGAAAGLRMFVSGMAITRREVTERVRSPIRRRRRRIWKGSSTNRSRREPTSSRYASQAA